MLHVAISSDFLRAFAAIPRNKQKVVRRALEKFKQDPTQSGLNYEPIKDMRDDKVRTLRAGDDYRIIVVAPPEGNVYLIMWVDHHDEAMAWARNKVFEVNQYTGTFQVWEGTQSVAPAAPANDVNARGDSDAVTSSVGKRLFSDQDDETLLVLGVPEPLLPAVRGLYTEGDLDSLARFLPREANDALYYLASGYSAEQTLTELDRRANARQQNEASRIDTRDIAAALQRDETQAQFKVIEDSHELNEILNAPLAQWRIFLHPSQRRLAQLESSGPVRVLGGAGTGKTVVALHRARHLAKRLGGADGRVLFTTFTKNLGQDISTQLDTLCGPERSRIEVLHLHGWASQLLRSRGLKVSLASDEQRAGAWERAISEAAPEELDDPDFLQDEWNQVVQAQGLLQEGDYLEARRVGRGRRLSRAQRRQVWRVFASYRGQLDRSRLMEADDMVREARLLLEQGGPPLYGAVVADEVQDFSENDLRLLRQLAPEGPNDLFLVGDAHQRIYGRVASLSRAGINVRGGRTRRLKLNYRTTQRIRSWAVALLSGMRVDDLDEGEDSLKGYHSLRQGSAPTFAHFATEAEEADFIVHQLRAWIDAGNEDPGFSLGSICLVARHRRQLEHRYQPMLERAGIAASIVTRDENKGAGVRLATMHRVKGLEFPKVMVVGVHEGELPTPRKRFSDDLSRLQHDESERRLLFVASTRARDELVITGFGEVCRFLALTKEAAA
jgi:superfamily I DNA/RNA helicase/mRNA-degrading endonuclease RelE of RelBE toxin-antitoxin system